MTAERQKKPKAESGKPARESRKPVLAHRHARSGSLREIHSEEIQGSRNRRSAFFSPLSALLKLCCVAIAATTFALLTALPTSAQTSAQTYPVRMRIEQMSIRLRSSSPIPVQIRLEYNRPQIMTGTLELHLYDALDVTPESAQDKLGTLYFEDLTLSGTDYIFNAILPPVRGSGHQNLAIQAWFVTQDERIPLSSSLKEVDPPKPHDVLLISPYERATLVCSVGAGSVNDPASPNRQFLDHGLSLENYNPNQVTTQEAGGAVDLSSRQNRRMSSMGRHIQNFSVAWNVRDLPADPLAYCCFDVVVLRDNSLQRVTQEQMDAMLVWVRAGGSLCIVPDGILKPQHLEFVRTLFEKPAQSADRYSLDDEGRLLVIGDKPDSVTTSYAGLGRAVLLPFADDLATVLSEEQLGQVVAFLWKVRSDQTVAKGQPWKTTAIEDALRDRGVQLGKDERGYYIIAAGTNYRTRARYQSERHYLTEDQIRETYQIDDRLAPVSEELLLVAGTSLMPSDVEMVPTWVIGLILAGYVLTIGPVDYLVLGLLRMRKATWVLFPVVTAFFTLLTIYVAHRYMSSTDTGGTVTITDLMNDGQPVRQTTVEMQFFGSSTTTEDNRRHQFVIPTDEAGPNLEYFASPGAFINDDRRVRTRKTVLEYAGHFPNNFRTRQYVQQWTPQLIRAMTLSPEVKDLPAIDWNDVSLVSTADGLFKLRQTLATMTLPSGTECYAVVLHKDQQVDLRNSGAFQNPFPGVDRRMRNQVVLANGYRPASEIIHQIANATSGSGRSDFFRIVSQVSPQGSGLLEDLLILDPSADNQWALVIVFQDGNDYRVFRKLYVVDVPDPEILQRDQPGPLQVQPAGLDPRRSRAIACGT